MEQMVHRNADKILYFEMTVLSASIENGNAHFSTSKSGKILSKPAVRKSVLSGKLSALVVNWTRPQTISFVRKIVMIQRHYQEVLKLDHDSFIQMSTGQLDSSGIL